MTRKLMVRRKAGAVPDRADVPGRRRFRLDAGVGDERGAEPVAARDRVGARRSDLRARIVPTGGVW